LDNEVPKSLSQVNAQIEKLQQQAQAIKAKELGGVIARIKDAIEHYGLTASDLGLTGRSGRKRVTEGKPAARKVRKTSNRRNTGVIKFRSADGQHTWTGHGRAPNWYKAALEAGATQDSMLVK
jgi:DNA-binding protein H-NS